MTMRIPDSILVAMARYYHHRDRQGQSSWDKAGDLAVIGKLCERHGLGLEAIAGTFFFTRVRGRAFFYVVRVQMTQDDYLDGGTVTKTRVSP